MTKFRIILDRETGYYYLQERMFFLWYFILDERQERRLCSLNKSSIENWIEVEVRRRLDRKQVKVNKKVSNKEIVGEYSFDLNKRY